MSITWMALGLMAQDENAARVEKKSTKHVCIVPVQTMPAAQAVDKLKDASNNLVTVSTNDDLKIVILTGPVVLVDAAVFHLKDLIDRSRAQKEGEEGDGGNPDGKGIELVRCGKLSAEKVVEELRRHVTDPVTIEIRKDVNALLIEGDAATVRRASDLARQINGKPGSSLRRILDPDSEGDDKE